MNWNLIGAGKNRVLAIAIGVLLAFRIAVAATFPLMDKTEARYAEISRIMAETGEWVVPQIDYGIPFWAKPPLSMWLSAASFRVIGVHELGARAPALVLSISLLVLLGWLAVERGHSYSLAAFVLLSIPQFLIHVGVVSTDATLMFCTTLVMISFWMKATQSGKPIWGYLFFGSIGLGILAKGPLVLVLTVPPLFIWWHLHKKQVAPLVQLLPWKLGVPMALLVALPWFYLMEQKSPGFIQYFVMGEHFGRFTESGWNGDLYGTPKKYPPGAIWFFLAIFAFPWIQIATIWLFRNRLQIFKSPWICFLFLWAAWTPLFFTLSSNILHTYILPVCPPLALIIVAMWEEYKPKKLTIAVSLIFPIVGFMAFVGFLSGRFDHYLNTDKELVTDQHLELDLFYWNQKTYSSQFYSKGRVKCWNPSQVSPGLGIHLDMGSEKIVQVPHYLLVSKRDLTIVPKVYLQHYMTIKKNQRTILLGPKTSQVGFNTNCQSSLIQ